MWCVHGIHTLPHFLPSKLEVRSSGSYFLIEERVGEVTSSRWGWRAAFIREKEVFLTLRGLLLSHRPLGDD